MEVLQIGKKDGGDGLLDDTFFIMGGNQHGHARGRVGHFGMVGAKLFDQGEQPDDRGTPADQNDAENEDHSNEETKPLV